MSLGLPIQLTAQVPATLPDGIGKFQIGGISAVLGGTCRGSGRTLNGLIDFFGRDYTTVTLDAGRDFAFTRRSPRASSGPRRFRISGKLSSGGTRMSGTVRGTQRQVLGARCRASGRFTAKRGDQIG